MTSRLCEVGFTWSGGFVPPEERVHVTLDWVDEGLEVVVDAPFHDDPPPPGEPGSLDGLWAYEVVEVFIVGLAPLGKPSPYLEIELSPHGHHLVIELFGVRERVRIREELIFRVERMESRWSGIAVIPFRYLPVRPHRFNVYSIHGPPDARRYLAMTPVPGPTPDFHRLERFAPWPFRAR